MRDGGGFRVLAALLLVVVIGFLTAGAFGAGYAAGSGAGATPAPAWAYGGAFGFGHLIGFLLAIFVLIIVLRLIMLAIFGHSHRRWGRHAYWHGSPAEWQSGANQPGFDQGGWPGGWQRSEWRRAGQAAFDEFHRQSHAAQQPPVDPNASVDPTR